MQADEREVLFSINDLTRMGHKINKNWMYRNCPYLETRKLDNGIENLYSAKSVMSTISKRRAELERNHLLAGSKKQEAHKTLNNLENAVLSFQNNLPKIAS